MLSRSLTVDSDSISSSSPSSVRLKKFVGGSCFGSPTIIVSVPRAIAPTASQVGICDASSKITRSNGGKLASRYWATEIGLISRQGFSRINRFGVLLNSARIGMCRVCFCTSLRKMPISELPFGVPTCCGTRASNRARSTCVVNSRKRSSSSLNSRIFSSCVCREKLRRISSSPITTSVQHS